MINETFTEDYYLVFSVYGLITFLIVWSHHFKEKVDQLENGSARYIDKLSIREGKTLIPVETNRIQWIDTDHPYIAIHTPEKTYLYSSNLRDVLKKLNPDQFVRIHRSTIVNLDYVSELTSRLTGDYDIKMKDGTELRLSRNYSRDVKNKLEQ
jgi:DNA-binding LytR/AlgR family response regulator